MELRIDISKYLTPVVRKSFNINGQAFAQTIPYILEDYFPNLSLLYLDKGRVVLVDNDGVRYKIVCSKDNNYDVFPSFTKGLGRCKDSVNWVEELESLCQRVIFVDIRVVDQITLRFKEVKALDRSCDGKVKF